MWQNRMDNPYMWIIVWLIVALLLLVAESIFMPQPAIALMNQVQETVEAFLFQTLLLMALGC